MSRSSRHLTAAVVTVLVANAAQHALAQSATGWTGTNGPNWGTYGNWDYARPGDTRDGLPIRNLYFGDAFTTGSTVSNNDLTGFDGHWLIFQASLSKTLTLTGNGFTQYYWNTDNGSLAPKVENYSGLNQNISLALNFNANTRSEINAVNGDLTFNAPVTMENGAGLQLYGSGHTVTFNAPVADTANAGRYVEVNQGNTAVFAANNTFTGSTYVYNGSTVRYTAGQTGTQLVFIGSDTGSGVASTRQNATVDLGTDGGAGGVTVAKTLVTDYGTGGTLGLRSLNATGTNAWSGDVYLNQPLTVTPVYAGGTLALTGNVLDLKSNTFTVAGAGQLTVANVVQNSSGSGAVVVNMAAGGKATFTAVNTYTGGTTINGGTVVANGRASSLGTGTTLVNGGVLAGRQNTGGPVTVNAGGTITAGSGATAADSIAVLTTGPQTWSPGGTYAVKFNATAGKAGTNWDYMTMSTLSLSALSAGNRFNILLLKTNASTFAAGTPASYPILTTLTAINSATSAVDLTSLFTLNSDALGVDESHFSVTTGSTGKGLVLAYDGGGPEAAPEPTTAVLAGVAFGVVLTRRRGRRPA